MNPNLVKNEHKLKLKLNEQETKKLKMLKNSPYSRWTQFNNEHTRALMSLALNHPKAHAILYFLVDQMDQYNAVMCSYKVLQDVLNISRATIQRNIQILRKLGFIAVLKSGTSNVYAINDTVYWKSWGNNKQYSKFPANIILSLEEQDTLNKKLFSIKYKKINTDNTEIDKQE